MLLNMGPSHPAMHGVIRIKVIADGETIYVAQDLRVGLFEAGAAA